MAKIQIKRGQKKNMPILSEGELGFAMDEKAVYIGMGEENISLASVSEHNSRSDFPASGQNNIIYIASDTGICYRWSGTQYKIISDTVKLGETAQTAYRGDRGKIAYDHSQAVGNPHNMPFDNVPTAGSDNPIKSKAVKSALDDKVDKKDGKELSSNDFTTAYKTKLDNAPDNMNNALSEVGKLNTETALRYGLESSTPSQAFDKAVQMLSVNVPASGWPSAPTSAGWHENRVNVTGMKAVYNPLLDMVITSATLAEDERAAFGLIMEAETFDGYVIFRALDVPDMDINVRFMGV